MTIQQLSVFIENKPGTMLQILNLLTKEGIQLLAVNIADTVEYGIFRIICSDPAKAHQVLKENQISVTLTEEFAVQLNDEVGAMARTLDIFNKEQISITYLYSFLFEGKGIMIFRTSDTEKTRTVIGQYGIKTISAR